MSTFKVGEKVTHASGDGPVLVIDEIVRDLTGVQICRCSYWNSKEVAFVKCDFPETSLQKY